MAISITLTDAQVQSVVSQDNTVASLQAQVTQLTADKAQLQSSLDTANATVTALQGKIAAAKTAAQADKDADDAREAGQGVLDALA